MIIPLDTGAGTQLVRIDLAAGEQAVLTRDENAKAFPHWSRDGRAVFFSRKSKGLWNVFRLDLETGAETGITQTGGLVAKEGLASGVIYYTIPGRSGIYEVAGPGETPRLLVPGVAPGDFLMWEVTDSGIIFPARAETYNLSFRLFDPAQGTQTEILDLKAWDMTTRDISFSRDQMWAVRRVVNQRESNLVFLTNLPAARDVVSN